MDFTGHLQDFDPATPAAELPRELPRISEQRAGQRANLRVVDTETESAQTRALAEGARWLLRAAEAGVGPAQYEYARLLLDKEIAARVPALGFSPKRAVFWLSKAAEQGVGAAAYDLALAYRNPAFSQQNAATSNRWLGIAASLGHAGGQYEYGAYLWRRRVSLGASADVEAANWLSKAKYQGVTAAADLLEKIVDPLPSVSPHVAQERRNALRAAAQANQCLALRLELAASFGLRKGEAFFFDPAEAVMDNILLVDVRGAVGKTRRRLFEIEGEGQAALLRRMRMMFSAGAAHEGDLHGDYGRRHAQMDAFCKKLNIDDSLFFAARADNAQAVALAA